MLAGFPDSGGKPVSLILNCYGKPFSYFRQALALIFRVIQKARQTMSHLTGNPRNLANTEENL